MAFFKMYRDKGAETLPPQKLLCRAQILNFFPFFYRIGNNVTKYRSVFE